MMDFEYICPTCNGDKGLHNPTYDDYGNVDECEDCEGSGYVEFSLSEDDIKELVGYVMDNDLIHAVDLLEKFYLKNR